jgi:hypothetical protein
MRRLVVLLAAVCGCGGGDGDVGADGGPDVADAALPEGDGLHRIDVPRSEGGTDDMWIYAAAPAGPGPFPVVIYGHGQGAGNFLNCTPDRPPDDGDATTGQAIAGSLADQGYLAVAVFYRNRGEGIPATGELRPRDAYILDARTMLAAARWARDRHGRGSAQVALAGVSMGSFPALWATAPLPEFADLQDGLTITTAISMGMLGNHIANSARGADRLESDDLGVRAQTIALGVFGAVTTRAAGVGMAVITAGDLEGALLDGVTPAGAELFRRALLDPPDPSLAGCEDLEVVAACAGACFEPTLEALAIELVIDQLEATDWLTADTLDSVRYWNPPDEVDPGTDTPLELLDLWRRLSPAYTLEGPLRSPRLLPLVSAGDPVVTAQIEGGNQAAEQFLARLRATDASVPDPVPVVEDTSCGHGDYLDASRPECGYAIVLAELAAAFAR